eukprot:Pgem_evm1s9210
MLCKTGIRVYQIHVLVLHGIVVVKLISLANKKNIDFEEIKCSGKAYSCACSSWNSSCEPHKLANKKNIDFEEIKCSGKACINNTLVVKPQKFVLQKLVILGIRVVKINTVEKITRILILQLQT